MLGRMKEKKTIIVIGFMLIGRFSLLSTDCVRSHVGGSFFTNSPPFLDRWCLLQKENYVLREFCACSTHCTSLWLSHCLTVWLALSWFLLLVCQWLYHNENHVTPHTRPQGTDGGHSGRSLLGINIVKYQHRQTSSFFEKKHPKH